MNRQNKTLWVLVTIIILAVAFSACNTMRRGAASPKLMVAPAKTVLSPALIRKPITFSGSGWKPKEMVVIDMILPPGVEVKGIKKGEDVGIAYATANDQGVFKAKMAPTATLNWLFQVGWTPLLKPDFKKARPLPPGNYTIRASGVDSEMEAKAILTIIAPPKKKK